MDVAQLATETHTISSMLLSWMGQAVVFGTLLAGATYLLTRLPRLRINPAIETCLWLIVLIKFVAPMGPAWPYSLSTLYQRVASTPSQDSIAHGPAALDNPEIALHARDLVRWSTIENGVQSHESDAPPVAQILDRPSEPPKAALPQWHWSALVGVVYLGSILALFVIRIQGYRRLLARCHALPEADESTCDLVRNVCHRVGVRRRPVIRISDRASAPFVMGFARPLLVLPRHLLVRPDELEAVIVHEIAHLRRSDMLVRYLQWVAGTLLFFWPVVAWVNRHLDMARELACDTWALRYGKLSAQEYARCLLRVARPARPPRFAYSPCRMATHPKTIERRIDMILQSPRASSHPRVWGLSTLALLVIWGGFTLTGANTAPPPVKEATWTFTEAAVHERATEVYGRVATHEAADFNYDGVLTYLEKDTYLVSLAMHSAESFMEEFPYADRNHSGILDILEAHGVIRAITLIAYADRRADAATEQLLPLEFCHAALDAQAWLLDNVTQKPTPAELDPIWSVLCRVQGSPRSYGARMFNHGGPAPSENPVKPGPGERRQFQELENNIAALKARLMATRDPDETDKLRRMLSKLEAVLSRLEGP
ncbi:MAG: M56 family metallopeptidase [Planctomycetes bacterium]|nr:M56 family metallopeptidase [Planctomycetota bacterium]